DADNYVIFANALFAKGRVDEAVAVLRRSLVHQPRNFLVNANLGNALVELGKYDEALPHLRTALEVRPDAVEALVALARALLHQGDPSGALSAARRARDASRSGGLDRLDAGITLKECEQRLARDPILTWLFEGGAPPGNPADALVSLDRRLEAALADQAEPK